MITSSSAPRPPRADRSPARRRKPLVLAGPGRGDPLRLDDEVSPSTGLQWWFVNGRLLSGRNNLVTNPKTEEDSGQIFPYQRPLHPYEATSSTRTEKKAARVEKSSAFMLFGCPSRREGQWSLVGLGPERRHDESGEEVEVPSAPNLPRRLLRARTTNHTGD